MKPKTRKEWFVVMATETADGDTVETCVILPSWWKVLLRLLKKGRKSCEIRIWTHEVVACE